MEKRFLRIATIIVTKEDAKRYLYSSSPSRRVHRWKDLRVNLYI